MNDQIQKPDEEDKDNEPQTLFGLPIIYTDNFPKIEGESPIVLRPMTDKDAAEYLEAVVKDRMLRDLKAGDNNTDKASQN